MAAVMRAVTHMAADSDAVLIERSWHEPEGNGPSRSRTTIPRR